MMGTWILFLVVTEIGLSHSLYVCSYGSCYGDRWVDFLKPQCNASQIAVQNLVVGAKKKDLTCPSFAHDPGYAPKNETACCRYEKDDCIQRYVAADGEDISTHYLNCTGQTDCLVNVAWTDRPQHCTTDVMDRTNYMVMEYSCISDVIDVCENKVIRGQNVYLYNPGYPNTIQPSHSGCSCSVETCSGKIDVTVLDMRLSPNGANACFQKIQLTDTGQTMDISCDNNTKFFVEKIYSSNDWYMEITLQNNATSNGGNFWIGFNNSNGEDVILSCGSDKSAKTAGLQCIKIQANNSEVNTVSTSHSTCSERGGGPSKNSTGTMRKRDPDDVTTEPVPDSKDNTAIIAGVVSAVAAAAAAAGLGAFARKKWLKNRIKPDDSPRQPIIAFEGVGGAPSGVAPAGTSLA